jgi:hypothetical protein
VLTCRRLQRNYTVRHETIASAVFGVLREFCFYVEKEPGDYCGGDDQQRQDIAIRLASGKVVVGDFTVIHNTARECRHSETRRPCDIAAQEKRQKHQANVEAKGAIFFPLVLESSGALHPDVDKFIMVLEAHLNSDQRKDFHKRMIFAFSNALMMGIANTILDHRFQTERRNDPYNALSGS